ncbi:MAG: hypothetical protein ACRESV_10400, partial [Nevskiales bacterium]
VLGAVSFALFNSAAWRAISGTEPLRERRAPYSMPARKTRSARPASVARLGRPRRGGKREEPWLGRIG